MFRIVPLPSFNGPTIGHGITRRGGMGEMAAGNQRSVPGTLAPPITVEITDPAHFSTLNEAWHDLIARAAVPNVSMHPVVAQASQAVGRAVHVVLAWQNAASDAPPRLVGVWVLAVERLTSRWPVPVLVSPVDTQMVLGTPVLDRECLPAVLNAMLDALAAAPGLPKILFVHECTADGAFGNVLEAMMASRGAPAKVLKRLTRPKLQSGLDGRSYLARTLPADKRQQLRRRRRRLAERGRLELTTHHTLEEVRCAFEEFLVLEASGWKGRGGSALSQRGQATAAFVRAMVTGLAQEGLVDIMVLRLDGRPTAVRIILWCGRAAYTWKTTYDEALRSYGPGLLLMEDTTLALLANSSLDYADSSTNLDIADIKAQADFWAERLDVADLLIDVRHGGSLMFRLLVLKDRLHRLRRTLALGRRMRRLYHVVAPTFGA
jgi:Acetyltransferase (GNAT) domain